MNSREEVALHNEAMLCSDAVKGDRILMEFEGAGTEGLHPLFSFY